MRASPTASVLALVLLAGCVAPTATLIDAEAPVPLAFTEPVVLTTQGPGFEPSVAVAVDGTVYATAAKTHRPLDGTTASSWLWYSRDGGSTWSELPAPIGLHKAFPGFEGDIAVDAKGRLYFVDTYVADNTISRWSPGPTWDFTRPLQGTLAVIDDRPWLTAHGDGIVYLMSNNGVDAPARMLLSASSDGGMTWRLAAQFPGQHFCMPGASPADDVSLVVACYDSGGAGASVLVHRSRDRADTWAQEAAVALENGAGYLAPGVAVDAAGHAYVAWLDDRVEWSGVQDAAWAGDQPGRIGVARAAPEGAFETLDVTPFEGRFGMLYAAAGRGGTLALTFYGTHDLSPDASSEWRAYALVTADADVPAPMWSLAELATEPMGVGAMPPRDFFQCAIGPDNVLHVVLQRNGDPAQRRAGDGIVADVLHVRQTAGANLG